MNWLQKNPIGEETSKGGGPNQGSQRYPEEAKGQESYYVGYWVKLIFDLWYFGTGAKLQGWLKPKMEAGFLWKQGAVFW